MIAKRLMQGVTAGLLGLLVVMGCAAIAASTAETPGERFDGAMKRLAEQCAKLKLPPNRTDCDPLKLKPADPLATPEGRFAHSIKIPNPVPEDSGYKPGMTSKEYFDHLCKTEAGEFIYKTVENVEGIYMLRPRKEATDYELQHLYAMEDPYGHTYGERDDVESLYVGPTRYRFLESPFGSRQEPEWKKNSRHPSYFMMPDGSAQHARYFGYNGRDPKTMQRTFDSVRKSKYGYAWRGIKRPHDRELGVAGGELIILDLSTNDVLAVRRGFIGSVLEGPRGFSWAYVCPLPGGNRGLPHEFIFKVLRPISSQTGGQDATK